MINQNYAHLLSNLPGVVETILELIINDKVLFSSFKTILLDFIKAFFKQSLNVLEAIIAANSNALSYNTYPRLYQYVFGNNLSLFNL